MMSRNWNRREMLRSLSLGVIAGNQLLAATAKARRRRIRPPGVPCSITVASR